MKAIVTDANAISSLSPSNLVSYLQSKGWSRYSDTPGRYSVWTNDERDHAELVLPYQKASDFVSLLSRALRELSIVELRSELDVLRDLLHSGFDIIRFAAKSPNWIDGSVPMDEGVTLFDQTKEIVLAAACATVEKKAVFRARKPAAANAYLRSARLGQTEQSSYVITLLSPVSSSISETNQESLFPPDPFERQVVKTLAASVSAAVKAAKSFEEAGDFSPFAKAVETGVSANLCDALSRLFDGGETSSVGMGVTWSVNRPAPDLPPQITIPSGVAAVMRKAAEQFRATDTIADQVVDGPVVKLERGKGDDQGRITVLAVIDDIARKIVVSLPKDQYELATEAHRSYRSVRLQGDITRKGKTYEISAPTWLGLSESN